METFTKIEEFVSNPDYQKNRQNCLNKIKIDSIDKPIEKIIKDFLKLPYCFTIQSCYGHFLYKGQEDPFNIKPLPDSDNIEIVEYRIAYVAFCLENSRRGKKLFKKLSTVPELDDNYIQFGCAGWFLKKYLNSYVLQVEPERFKTEDKAFIPYREALYIEKLKKNFFKKLHYIIQ